MLSLLRKKKAADAPLVVPAGPAAGAPVVPAGGVAVLDAPAGPGADDATGSAVPVAVAALVSRRPLLDADGFVRGHELTFGPEAAELPLAELAVAARAVAGTLPAWLRATGPQILASDPIPADAGRIVVQIDGDEPVGAHLRDRLRALRSQGHGVALADALSPRRDHLPLWPIVTHVMVDVAQHGLQGLETTFARRAQVGPQIVAGSVDTHQAFDACARLGVAFVQGFYFEQPQAATLAGAAGASLRRLRTLTSLHCRPAFEDVHEVVTADPALTVHLLRYANSAAVSAGRTLDTVRDAMMVLGAEQVRRFVLGVVLSDLGAQRPALVAAAMFRARLCEELVREHGAGDADAAFTVGMLSVADALLDQPMGELLRSMPVGDEVHRALMTGAGPLGAALATTIRLERERGTGSAPRFARLHEVVAWADDALAGLAA